MLKRLLCLTLAVGLGLAGYALTQRGAVAGQKDDQHIAELVKKLGSMNYAEREKAKKDLEMIGTPALEQLRLAAKNSDLETRTRCEKLIEKCEAKAVAENLLAPKKVRLNLKDATVVQAVEELQKQSGYPILIDGDRAALAKRKITIDTGEVTFWEAYDRLCEKANLMQVQTGNFPHVQPYPQPGPILRGGANIQPQPVPAEVVPPKGPAIKAPLPGGATAPGALPPGANKPLIQVDEAKAGQAGPAVQAQVVQLQVQVELPAAGGNAKVIMPIQVGVGQAQAGAAQAQPGQVQAQPFQVQIQPVQPGLPGPGVKQPPFNQGPFYPPGTLVGRDGAFEKVPTSYSGALRIRLLPASRASEIAVQPRQEGEALFILEVSAEPRLQMFSVNGSPRVERALDDVNQELAVAMEPMADPAPAFGGRPVYGYGIRSAQQVALRLKLGAKQAKELTELKGAIAVEALSPLHEALITVSDLEKSIGKKVEGKSGGSLEVSSFKKQENGSYEVKVLFQTPQPFFPGNLNNPGAPFMLPPQRQGGGGFQIQGGAVQVQGGVAQIQVAPAQAQPAIQPGQPGIGGGPGMQPGGVNLANMARTLPQLVDAKGKVLTLEQIPQRMGRGVNGQFFQEVTMVYRAGDGVGEPTQLVLFGHRKVTAEATFAFKTVPLP